MRRRRLVAATALAASLAGVVVINMGLSGAAPQPPRQHAVLSKMCPKAKFSPSFVVDNVTDDASLSNDKQTYEPETLVIYITKGSAVPDELSGQSNGVGYITKVTLTPGQVKLVHTAADVPWGGPHFAHFEAEYRGVTKIMSSRQTCHCEEDDPTANESTSTVVTTTSAPPTSTSSSSSSTSTSSTSTSSTSTSTVPEETTTSTAPTSTSTVPEETTTSSSTPAETTTSFVIDDS